MDHYSSEGIRPEVIRAIARKEPWRTIWSNGKKQSNLLGKPADLQLPVQNRRLDQPDSSFQGPF